MKFLNDLKYFRWLWIAALIVMPFASATVVYMWFTNPKSINHAEPLRYFRVVNFDKSGKPEVLFLQDYSKYSSEAANDRSSLHKYSHENKIFCKEDNRPNGPYKFHIDPAKTKWLSDILTKHSSEEWMSYSVRVIKDDRKSGTQVINIGYLSNEDGSGSEYVYWVHKNETVEPLAYGEYGDFLEYAFYASLAWIGSSLFIAVAGAIWNDRLKAMQKRQGGGYCKDA